MCQRTLFLVVVVTSLAVSAAVGSGKPGDQAYTFSINGQAVMPQHYSPNGDTSVMVPGDVICLGGGQFNYGELFMTLGDEADCRFVTIPPESIGKDDASSTSLSPVKDGRVFLELPDGRRKVVAAIVTMAARRKPADPNAQAATARQPISFERTLVNPLDTMSPEEIHGLWGIYLNTWPEGIEQKLAHVNTDLVCIAISDYAGVGGKAMYFGGPEFPPLPTKIRYLVVKERMSPGLRDFTRMGQFRDLTFLIFESLGEREALDAALISQSTSLRYLDVSRGYVMNYAKLASLTDLRYLDISGRRNLEDIEFVKDMQNLRTLLVGRTAVSSLSPLDGSDSIREVYAGMTRVRNLPKGDLRSLRVIDLISTQVDAQTVATFRAAHAACRVEHDWEESLRRALRETTRLRVRSGGTCHRRTDEEKTLVDIMRQEEIERLLDEIHIDEAGSGFHCMCCGDPTFEFYFGEQLLAMIGYHHGESLRWAEGRWTGDGLLTKSSQAFLIAWLAEHGVDGPRREKERQQKQHDAERDKQQRYTEIIPKQTRNAVAEAGGGEISWREDTRTRVERQRKLEAEAFQKYEVDAASSVEMYLRILGVRSDGPWNRYYEYDVAIVQHLLPRFKGAPLAEGTLRVMRDDEGASGAARWLFGEMGWRNLDETDREKVLPALARRSLEHRDGTARKQTMAALSDMNSAWAVEILRSVLSRPIAPGTAFARAGAGREIDLGAGNALWSGEYSDAAWAAFCLAKLGDRQSMSTIEKLVGESEGKDKDLLAEALQLLRDKRL